MSGGGMTVIMGKFPATLLFVGVVAVLIIFVDVVFFRHYFWPRLAANIGIVLLVGAFYFRFFRGHA
ncbi:hypothetical protein FOE78_23375 [Microlunatus elymi]|uniref:Uncharacterized protein n=1 Tax=Microlunatus elymi TaxID=2596828 RepID=A0A516Q4T0_9ACTN|nr:hypothetical protein [Microlunatus elymi]QDP98450.1 hypothetical protein FOE78_23375 [Microlunatus elymi]